MKHIRKEMVLMLWPSSFFNLMPAVPCKISSLCLVFAMTECVQWNIFRMEYFLCYGTVFFVSLVDFGAVYLEDW